MIRPTLIERLNGLFPVPYPISTLIVALLLGPLGFLIADLLSSPNIAVGVNLFATASLDHYTASQVVGNNLVYPGIIFYCALMLRYMRRSVARFEEELILESPEWQNRVRSSFEGISGTGPALAITLLIFFLSLPLVVFQVSNNQGFSQLYFLITYPLFFFAAGSFIWMYVSSLWGLRRIGTEPVKLKPFAEDPLMGMGAFGKISLTLTVVFLVAVFLALFEFVAFSTAMPVLLTIAFSGGLILLGVGMFFLPLTHVHRRMIGEREKLRNLNMSTILGLVSNDHAQENRSEVQALIKILSLEYEHEQISSIPSWPFDVSVVRSLVGIVFAVIASTAAHIIIVFLGV